MDYEQVQEFLREYELTVHSHSADKQWAYFTDPHMLGVEVDFREKTFTLKFSVGISIQVSYTTLGLHLLNKDVFELALHRMDRINDSRVVKLMRKDYIESMRS